ncbi:hypothetical protein [Cryobacterium sp. MLB-32]|uniref:hypothetical protein n=1 Tax=Cryobacterium sp. MLB-32 TaxID=1529318 RepID=UPI0012DFF27F|nr:hypothetical protein [Cryobacterium sp. MLB-32]
MQNGDPITGDDEDIDLDMLDFANAVTGNRLSRLLLHALDGRGVFRRSHDNVFQQAPPRPGIAYAPR